MDETVRVERGPLLRTFERPRIVEGGMRGEVSVQWPKLTLKLTGFDTCRTEVIEEYAEDKIHERNNRGAGAALSAGVIVMVGGAILFGVSYAFSDAANIGRIDGAGNYGPSPRLVARTWSIPLFVAGLTALGVSFVQYLLSGEKIDTV